MQTTESFWRGNIWQTITQSTTVPFTLNVSYIPENDNQYITISPDTVNEEIFYYTTKNGTAWGAGTLNITARGYNKHNSLTDVSNQKEHDINSEFKLSSNHLILNEKVDKTTLASTANWEGASTIWVEDSEGYFNSTDVEWALEELAVGAPWVADANETIAGKVELATELERSAGTSIGSTGARLVPTNDSLVKTYSGSSDKNKIPLLNSSWLIEEFISDDYRKKTVFTAKCWEDIADKSVCRFWSNWIRLQVDDFVNNLTIPWTTTWESLEILVDTLPSNFWVGKYYMRFRCSMANSRFSMVQNWNIIFQVDTDSSTLVNKDIETPIEVDSTNPVDIYFYTWSLWGRYENLIIDTYNVTTENPEKIYLSNANDLNKLYNIWISTGIWNAWGNILIQSAWVVWGFSWLITNSWVINLIDTTIEWVKYTNDSDLFSNNIWKPVYLQDDWSLWINSWSNVVEIWYIYSDTEIYMKQKNEIFSVASDRVVQVSETERSKTLNDDPTKFKEIEVNRDWTIRVKVDVKWEEVNGQAFWDVYIYVNGVSVEDSSFNFSPAHTNYVTESRDISVTKWDLIQIYMNSQTVNSVTRTVYCKNFRVCYDEIDANSYPVVNLD